MKSVKIDPNETGWVSIDANVKTVVAHFKDGNKETYGLFDFLTLKSRIKKNIVQVDCYTENEKVI